MLRSGEKKKWKPQTFSWQMSQGTIGFCIGMFTLLLFTLFLSVQIHSLQSLSEASSQFSQNVKQLLKNLSATKGFPRVYTNDGKSRKIFLKPSYVMAFFFHSSLTSTAQIHAQFQILSNTQISYWWIHHKVSFIQTVSGWPSGKEVCCAINTFLSLNHVYIKGPFATASQVQETLNPKSSPRLVDGGGWLMRWGPLSNCTIFVATFFKYFVSSANLK